ncbi:MAG: hypothetical protein ACR2RE_02460 [Geminicoccaceae bacterium]
MTQLERALKDKVARLEAERDELRKNIVAFQLELQRHLDGVPSCHVPPTPETLNLWWDEFNAKQRC